MGGRVRVQHLCFLQAVGKGPFNLLCKTLSSFEVSTPPRLANKPLLMSHDWRCTGTDPLVTGMLPASISPAQATCASQNGLSDSRVDVSPPEHVTAPGPIHYISIAEIQMSFPSFSFTVWRNSPKFYSHLLSKQQSGWNLSNPSFTEIQTTAVMEWKSRRIFIQVWSIRIAFLRFFFFNSTMQ